MSINRTLLIAGILIAGSGAAIAQAPPAPSTPPAQTAPPAADRANANCTPTQTNSQGTITPDSSGGKSSDNLGDKLAKSDGVLCPPSNVDSAMRAPAPKSDNSNTPVIPPPGSPGGDPSIRPK